MLTVTSTTRWLGEPIAPQNYEDIRDLVKLGRQARGKPVEFAWHFTREDLESLRRAVHEWGSGVVGTYKCFDARVLAAINEVLGSSLYVLNEPKNMTWVDHQVRCEPLGDLFRLHGRTSFDIAFGYGHAGVAEDVPGRVHLTQTARDTLAAAVGLLGWDLGRLQEPKFRPVRNVIYGVALGAGTTNVTEFDGPAIELAVSFDGPFSAVAGGDCPCLFEQAVADHGGVYLWTVNVGGEEMPWYVGKTERGFGQRTAEHLRSMLAGEYPVLSAEGLARGEYLPVERAVYPNWPKTLPAFLADYERLLPHILSVIRMLRFHVARVDGGFHERVEGALGRYYKTHLDARFHRFFGPGLKLPAAIPGEQPLRLRLTSRTPICGLPSELMA